ncbi:hypothetical protein CC2G_005726 [Coprinopsis cinerea AmutBmut pab1-1]|nr:hypothetical protein CC2G_005726 [Coprinopsis cinerea AmutBmut pab1-1]
MGVWKAEYRLSTDYQMTTSITSTPPDLREIIVQNSNDGKVKMITVAMHTGLLALAALIIMLLATRFLISLPLVAIDLSHLRETDELGTFDLSSIKGRGNTG